MKSESSVSNFCLLVVVMTSEKSREQMRRENNKREEDKGKDMSAADVGTRKRVE
jgi:hypothetical protein